ncbi:hypothetical protein NECAME_14798 [Necator americanus]|uniref:Uncharacterized protein n=1 Tax=Necator americanus TaxID=51031 RepID=W2SNY0_NECAM|nr:hypothetical protein NECAME_14798 [Necator americanus]ETN70407.1 hypothetical protein NECAME_14798 [Necator americanus]
MWTLRKPKLWEIWLNSISSQQSKTIEATVFDKSCKVTGTGVNAHNRCPVEGRTKLLKKKLRFTEGTLDSLSYEPTPRS